MKLSPGKITAPGPKQIFRGLLTEGDIVGVRDEPVPTGHEPLLVPVMLGGQPTGANADLAAAQARFEDDLGRLPVTARALQDARPPPVRLSEQLEDLRERVRAQLPHRDRPHGPDWSGWAGRLGGRPPEVGWGLLMALRRARRWRRGLRPGPDRLPGCSRRW
jgi:hypothetical protein